MHKDDIVFLESIYGMLKCKNVKVYCAFLLTVFGVDLKAKNFPSISDVFPDIVSLINLPSKTLFFLIYI